MSFLLDHTKTNIIMSCVEEHSICTVECKQNLVQSLAKRTSGKRNDLLKKFYDFFGREKALKVSKKGSGNVVWQGKTVTKKFCTMSKRRTPSLKHTQKCEAFCNRNLICPSHVTG